MAARVVTTLPYDPALVFGVLSDSNRWDRLLGVPPTRYTVEALDPARPASRTRVGRVGRPDRAVAFTEEGEYWAPSRLFGERVFLGAFARWMPSAFLEVEVVPEGAGARVIIQGGAQVRTLFGWALGVMMWLRVWVALRRYLRGVTRLLARAPAGPVADVPPAARARRALWLGGDGGEHVSGRHAAATGELAVRAQRFERAPVEPAIRARIVALLTEQPDEALLQIRPFEAAAAWQADRREVLRGFLHAAHAGLFELEWQIDCPTCRVGAGSTPRLDALGPRVHCDECDISFDVDFADNVEVTFTASPAVRKVARVVWCASSPYWRPHVHGFLTVPPRQRRTVEPLPAGALLLRARGSARQLRHDGPARPLAVRITDDAILRVAHSGGGGADELRIDNATDAPVRFLVERAGWSAERALGRLLISLPDFVELFGTEAPATGVQLSVGTMAVLFTDVVGSTELYEQLGDARAFALIQRHWRACEAAASRHHGTVLKTLGDGLFCCFTSLADAAAAAAEMMAAATTIAAAADERRFAIRAAVHEGPCYLVRGAAQLDLFGSTVNLASRLLSVASGSQLAMLAASAEHPGVLAVLDEVEARVETIDARLRGLRGSHTMVIATLPDAAVFVTGEHAALTTTGEHAPAIPAGVAPAVARRARAAGDDTLGRAIS